ncbi:metal ABC transporter permease, partial [Enterobacter hormaechei]|nr:metal ABC transporter permease [Enterobacter hormaechei]
GLLLMAGISGIFCAWLGLSLSWAVSLPAGPSIVLTASALFFISVLFGTRSRLADSLRALF